MQRVVRLSLFALVVIASMLGSAWVFREQLLGAVGISFDRGVAGETALVLPDGFGVHRLRLGSRRSALHGGPERWHLVRR